MAPAEPTIPLNTGYINDYPRQPSLKRLQQNFGAHPQTQFESLQHLGKCHTESFNFMLTDGLKIAIEDLERVEFQIPETGARIGLKMIFKGFSFSQAQLPVLRPNSKTQNQSQKFQIQSPRKGTGTGADNTGCPN